MSFFDSDCEWYCDNCDAHLNNQIGFSTLFGNWICSKCGWNNDVSDNNILSGEEEFVRLAYVVCPHCGAHMLTDNSEHYKCPDCNCTGTYDYNLDILVED